MTETCKYCKKEMKFLREKDDYGYTKWYYECHNEDCKEQPELTVIICNNCESVDYWWDP